ncbi:carbohydrate kinase family protein [Brackiella oedipodis]|uniref:carbohydrate kinase family protein n=1 Tax=Brackiella oedipodis TaxID=124225 RepID=UPI00048BE77B|nr:carbohydrate kinase family protein [Brackiella oedipodis]
MSKDVLICGSIAYDTITQFHDYFKNHILPENVHSLSISFLVPTMRKDFGGCAGNIAYNLHKLGGQAVPVAAVGKDFGDYKEHLDRLGITQRCIKVFAETFTAQCHITTDKEGNQIAAFHPGAMELAVQNQIDEPKAAWGIIAPESKDSMIAKADYFYQHNIPFIFDLGQAMPLFSGEDILQMLAKASVLTANDYEASIIEHRTNKTISELAQQLKAVVITRGTKGAELYENGQTTTIPAVKPEKIEDPTGCGDAHRAGLLYGLSQGWSWLNSCRLGSIMGSLKIASQGPQNHDIDLDHVKALFTQNFQENPWQAN